MRDHKGTGVTAAPLWRKATQSTDYGKRHRQRSARKSKSARKWYYRHDNKRKQQSKQQQQQEQQQ